MERERKRKKETYINLILTSLFQNHRVHSNQRSSLYSPIPKNQRKTANPLHLTAVPSFNILYFQCICSESLNCIPRLILINNLFVPQKSWQFMSFWWQFPFRKHLPSSLDPHYFTVPHARTWWVYCCHSCGVNYSNANTKTSAFRNIYCAMVHSKK